MFQKRLRALEAKVAQERPDFDRGSTESVWVGQADKRDPRRDRNGVSKPYYVRMIKGDDRTYQQTFIDTYSRVVCTKLYDRKNALVAADLLNDRVVSFFESQEVRLLRILTDQGTEYCGKREHQEYQLYLAVEDIDHTKTKAKSPQTNGICERLHRTMQEEFYAVAFRKKLYESIEALQEDLDNWVNWYNNERTHSGRHCYVSSSPMPQPL